MELGNMFFGNSRGAYEVDRGLKDDFCKLFNDMDIDCYGVYEGEDDAHCNHRGGYENEVFITRPYWWGDDDSPKADLPNFEYKPTGFKMNWYKYALRDAYMNQELSFDEIKEILVKCKESMI